MFANAIIRYIPDALVQDENYKWNAGWTFAEIATVSMQPVAGSTGQLYRRWIIGLSSNSLFPITPGDNDYPESPTSESLAQESLADSSYYEYAAFRSDSIMAKGEPCGFLSTDQFRAEGNVDMAFTSTGYSSQCKRFLSWAIWPTAKSFVDLQKLREIEVQPHPCLPYDKRSLGWGLGSLPHQYSDKRYRFVLGTSKLAVFQPVPLWKDMTFDLDLAGLIQAMKLHHPDQNKLVNYMESFSLNMVEHPRTTPNPCKTSFALQ